MVNPNKLFPVHTENPELFEEIHKNTTSPVLGEPYALT
jgi:hypothetical protein